ncbi:radical SAM protein [Fontibacillus sp. BL9]|uniref:radical SAM protein n=1 Tax=Fontibacillus sp. BL9 TaxID=3389971 RepID=UPI00397D3636
MIEYPRIVENHVFKMNDQSLLFDVNRCKLFSIDDPTSVVAELCDGRHVQALRETAADILSLRKEEIDQLLSELDEAGLLSEAPSVIGSKFEELGVPTNYSVSALALHVIHDCNLRCAYCYGGGGDFGGERVAMSEEVALKAVDFLIRESGDQQSLNITFFGGEPLMNLPLIKKVTEYCRQKERETGKTFNLGMTTNGTLLTDKTLKYLNENRISVGISIDGPKETHDKYRRYEDQSGSFDRLMEGTRKLLDSRDGRVTARITVTRDNLNIVDITKFISELGFRKVNLALVSTSDGSPLSIRKEDLHYIAEQYQQLAEEFIASIKEKKRYFINVFTSRLELLHNRKFMFYDCGAGRRYMAVSPEGGIYMCHRFVGMEEQRMGDLDHGFSEDMLRDVVNSHVEQKEGCGDCWARYMCGGGCFYNSVEKGGTLRSSPGDFCDSYKSLFETTMYLYHQLQSYDDTIIDRLLAPRGSNYFDEIDEMERRGELV